MIKCPERSRNRGFTLWIALCIAVLSLGTEVSSLRAQGRPASRLPAPQGYVSDFARILNQAEADALTRVVRTLDETRGVQMAIVTMSTLNGEPAASYARRLAITWGVGRRDGPRPNSGILVLIVPRDTVRGTRGEVRIEVADGASPVVPDDVAQQIVEESLPLLVASEYGSALLLISTRLSERFAPDHGLVTDP